ncbi:MAG TPA: hypothetical protein VM582_03120 [Candidatus Thermoplasmatota archaeon]|nr:hypothetical protein [Candidatus Thermoplasmatota archaeon]
MGPSARALAALVVPPIALAVAALALGALACDDGWCAGALAQVLLYDALLLALLVGAFRLGRRMGLAHGAAAGMAWLVGLAAIAGVVAGSQAYEGDARSGLAAAALALAALGAAAWVARPRSRGAAGR